VIVLKRRPVLADSTPSIARTALEAGRRGRESAVQPYQPQALWLNHVAVHPDSKLRSVAHAALMSLQSRRCNRWEYDLDNSELLGVSCQCRQNWSNGRREVRPLKDGLAFAFAKDLSPVRV